MKPNTFLSGRVDFSSLTANRGAVVFSIWDMDRQTQQLMRLVRLMRTLRLAKASRLIFRLTKR